MASLRTSPTHFFVLPPAFSNLKPHSSAAVPFSDNFPRGSRMKQEGYLSVSSAIFKEPGFGWGGFFLGFRRKGCYFGCGFLRKSRNGWEGEGNITLEAEILEFTQNSDKPATFPTKRQLIEAGRMDLVDGILREGGWLASGWDLDEEEYGIEEEKQDAYGIGLGHNNDVSSGGLNEMKWQAGSVIREGNEEDGLRGSIQFDSQPSASSSSRSPEGTAEDDMGIEGILTRLDKEREINFGVGLKEKGSSIHAPPREFVADWSSKTSIRGTAASLARNVEAAPLQLMDSEMDDMMSKHDWGKPDLNVDNFSNSHVPDSWRAWSMQRAGSSNMEFEAGEISYDEIRTGFRNIASNGHGVQERGGGSRFINPREERSSINNIGHHDIRSRLQTLEVELSSVLQTLKSHSGENLLKTDRKSSSRELLKLSDDWEFQENEIMNARDKLRSIRAKLAVLEGKMALAVIEAQKVVEVKQKKIDDAHVALRPLRNACIVWPNSASEVLLAGSFDGWASQRKMEKSKTGIFSLYLKLYPGRYEIKFIVDGEWKVDPLRPIVRNNGHENNHLLIIS